ncbi:MAG: flagellar protein FlaG [Burkholderiaceae bacterium]
MTLEITPGGDARPLPVQKPVAHAVPPSNAPKVTQPKPVAIQFDRKQANENLKAAISLLNQQMVSTHRGLGFSFDDSKSMAVIKVTDINTGAVVRQIPTEDVLRMAHKIDDLKGILYNQIA